MNSRTIQTMMVWLRHRYPTQAPEVTLYNLFVGAHIEHFQVFDDNSEQRVLNDLEAYERDGGIPEYVSRFVRRICAIHLVVHQPNPRRRFACMSDTR